MIEAQEGADSGTPCETAGGRGWVGGWGGVGGGALTLCGHEELDATVQLSRARMKGRRIQITLRCVRVWLCRVRLLNSHFSAVQAHSSLVQLVVWERAHSFEK